MRKCNKCGVNKPLSEFRKQKKHSDGVKHTCKKCLSETDKQYRQINVDKIKKYQSSYNCYDRKTKQFKSKYGLSARTIYRYGFKIAIAVYERDGRKCKKCGEENDLTIHHKDRNGYNNLVKGLPANNKLSNLIVLCRKCHGRIHGLDSHKN